MINNKKAIVCDLDGTLAKSKSSLTPEMSEVLCKLLSKHYLVVVSGGAYSQFQKQFLTNFSCPKELLKNLSFFPTMGSTCYVYDYEKDIWKQLYDEKFSDGEKLEIMKALKESIAESSLDLSSPFGEIIEDRGSQITFSGRGQDAPIEIKVAWDHDQAKRKALVELIKAKIPQFEISIGGTTSIDVTRKGIDKAYAIGKIKNLLKVNDEDIIFVGDALWKGGNDSPVKKTGVDYIQEDGPDETLEFLKQYI
ncbi:MAG: HAD-superfamily hydrolase [Parcubacteria group bacterium Gr01-1014_46]|nr:MAG: HAD-superfamily hydrolase [Parcubacteria group bacterium Gr01-1014_46]